MRGYFLLALPAGMFARRYGYRGGILFGLSVIAVGCVCFVPVTKIVASQMVVFSFFLLALGLVACGFTFIETIANPYATVLGAPEAGVARINLAQSCNAVGWIFGPLLGGSFILSKTEQVNTSNAALYLPYLIVAGIVTVLLVAFALAPVPDLHAAQEARAAAKGRSHERPLFREWHFVLAIASQFLYCAAQTGIFSFFINYLKDPRCMPALPAWLADLLPANMKYLRDGVWHITDYCAGAMLSLAFIFFTVGRFSGSAILRFAPAHRVLGLYALANVVLMGLVFLGLGWVSVVALILSFFFMSIMYPTHFALAIRGLGERTKLASSWMVTAIVGGAVMPMLMGWLADHYSMRVGFLMPMALLRGHHGLRVWLGRLYSQDMEPEVEMTEPRKTRETLTGPTTGHQNVTPSLAAVSCCAALQQLPAPGALPVAAAGQAMAAACATGTAKDLPRLGLDGAVRLLVLQHVLRQGMDARRDERELLQGHRLRHRAMGEDRQGSQMGYILFLTKHHDGFCLWDTKTTDRKVTKSPLGRDVSARIARRLRQARPQAGALLLRRRMGLAEQARRHTLPGQRRPQPGNEEGPTPRIAHRLRPGGIHLVRSRRRRRRLEPCGHARVLQGAPAGLLRRLQPRRPGRRGHPPGRDGPARARSTIPRPPVRTWAMRPARNYRLAEFTYPILPPHEGGAMWFYSLPQHDNSACRRRSSTPITWGR